MIRTTSPFVLGYSVLSGPIIWFVHFVAVYSLAEFGCRSNFTNLIFITPETMRLTMIVLTVVSVIGVGFGGILAFRAWSQVRKETSRKESAYEARFHFLTLLGMLLSALFILSILFTVAPAFVLSVCDKAI
ncbi:MAG: hypothetical protein LCI00_05715 [Chloroflexi bacterium]|nr:hypothetical protein [Chloroflexota bacterium]MCC6896492.1 hypothetical protein [Anaerolineae bacterium]